ncbi:Alpha/beta-Hydrolases superfamily protein isoform 1 [Hibiscus syriacus]|uniref:Transcription repressor n=1 Tax=Hibiscus syriacus TaxID=106335 RepID=A0A6A3B8K4_HIBSY|nr:transcription repressor OFP6-like [Hibiscus syriacus]KAE8713166.1 Alpha/beta-Hydrolases superfamily protein isoform 1 [Hibiscus syriacus]
MSLDKKKLFLNTVSVSLGCNSCKKLKLSSFFDPKPQSPPSKTPPPPSSEFGTLTSFPPSSDTTTQYWDMDVDKETKCSTTMVRGFGRVGGESLAVEKESDDPYLDFRYSMLQMILEKEIYSKDDLKELLNCFLKLNSSYYHDIILTAFTDIWNGVFSINPADDSLKRSSLYLVH